MWWRAVTVLHQLDEQERHGTRTFSLMRKCFVRREQEKTFSKINAWAAGEASSSPSSKSCSCFLFAFSLYAFHQKNRSFCPLHSCSDQSFKLTKPYGKWIFYLWLDEAWVLTKSISPSFLPSENVFIFINGKLSVGEPKKPSSGFAITTR